mgnify:CR=1 FL=1
MRAWNNANLTELLEAEGITDLAMTVYDPLPPHPRAMYLRFDGSPHGMPLSMLLQIAGETILPSKILFEAWDGTGFAQVRTVDQTKNLRYTGTAFLYISQPVPEATFFGETGCWLRMSLSSFTPLTRPAPQITGLDFNIVEARQQQRGADQYFSTEAYEVDKTLELLETPVLECQVWWMKPGSCPPPRWPSWKPSCPAGSGWNGGAGDPLLCALGAGAQSAVGGGRGPGL